MGPHCPTGWNTWDFRGFNRLVFLRQGRTELILQYAVWDETVPPSSPDSRQIGKLHDAFRWKDVQKLGPHGPLGLPAVLEFMAGPVTYTADARDEDGALRLTVTPHGETSQRIIFMFVAPIGETVEEDGLAEGTFAGWKLCLEGATWPKRYFVNVAEPYAVAEPGGGATLIAWHGDQPRSSSGLPERATVEALTGSGALADAPEAMMQAVNWNTLYDSRRRLISSPVSRDWCCDWRGALVFCWDTFLVGAMASYESRALARVNFETVTAPIDEIGMVPNYWMGHGAVSLDRSMPPLGSYAIWKVEGADPDPDWLAPMYKRLAKWHQYWMPHRDGNGDGLLEWGSDASPAYEFPQLRPYNPSLQHEHICAMYEAGLDNSPMYDDVAFNKTTNTLEIADVALNSYYAMDCESLAFMAEALGDSQAAEAYREEHRIVGQRISDVLWDEEHGIYANRHWDGFFSKRWSPTSFFPLVAGVAPADRAERIVHEHLLNDEEFWGQYVLPSIARSDPAFADNDYWRGRIWGPFNFLVVEGLRRYGFYDVAAELAERSLSMFLENWRRDGGIYENYNAVTGEGGDVWNAARLYHWGGLTAFIAIQELVDVEPAGFLRLGSVSFPDCGVRNVHVGSDVYDVDAGASLRAERNGSLFAECDAKATVRLPLRPSPDRPIEIFCAGPGRLSLHQSADAMIPARINGKQLVNAESAAETITYKWG